MSVNPEEIARARFDCKDGRNSNCNPTDDPYHSDRIGVLGEVAFAKAYGFAIDPRPKPQGDGGVDFVFTINGRPITIDVKTALIPRYLLVQKQSMGQCADILVLQEFDRGVVRAIGWETRSVMAVMPTIVFNAGTPPAHFRAASELRPMGQLANLLAMRGGPMHSEQENEK